MENIYNRIISELDSEVIALCCLYGNDSYTRLITYLNWSDEQRKSAILNDRETFGLLKQILELQNDICDHIAYLEGLSEYKSKVNLRYLRMEHVNTLEEIKAGIEAAKKREAKRFQEEIDMTYDYMMSIL